MIGQKSREKTQVETASVCVRKSKKAYVANSWGTGEVGKGGRHPDTMGLADHNEEYGFYSILKIYVVYLQLVFICNMMYVGGGEGV